MDVTKLKSTVEKPLFLQVITGVIILNAIILGMKSYPSMMLKYGYILDVLDDVMIAIFVCELMVYLVVYGAHKCFTDPWYLFDFAVISIALIPMVAYILSHFLHVSEIPDLGHFSALRAMRVLRVLRLVTVFPNLRKVVQGLIAAIPGIGSIAMLMAVALYVFALISTNMYRDAMPEYFGSIQSSLFSLFQIMTAESWASAIARPLMEFHPYSWIFFVAFMLVTSFIVLNLFIAVIVDVMQKDVDYQESEEDKMFSLHEIKAMLKEINEKLDKK